MKQKEMLMNPSIQLKQISSKLLVVFGIACFELSSAVQALSPPPDGGYPGANTAEGTNALQNLEFIGNEGVGNTALGWYSLFTDRDGHYSTAVGAGALALNTADENTRYASATRLTLPAMLAASMGRLSILELALPSLSMRTVS